MSSDPYPLAGTPRPRVGWICAALTTITLVAAGCGGGGSSSTPDVPTVTPATASPAPTTPTAPPVGVTVPVPQGSSTVVASGTRIATLGPGGTSVQVRDGGVADAPVTTITTPALTAVAPAARSGFVGVAVGEIVTIGADNTVRTVRIPSRPALSVASAPDGRVLVGTANGHLLIYSVPTAGGEATLDRDVGGFVRVDEITVSPAPDHQVLVLDRAQSSVTPVDTSTGELGAALRAGNGATNATVDHFGRVSVANTRDGEILGFYGTPLVMRFRYPVAGGPYAVDYDDTRDLLWVSTTANNEVVGYDLSGGEPTAKYRYATVDQPDSIAVDDTSGTLYILSARSGLLQILTPGSAPSAAPPAR